MSIQELQDYAIPQQLVRGTPARIQLGEVQTINDDGTVDVRPVLGRATKVGLPVPQWYAPRHGDRVLYGDLHGDARTPVVISPFSTAPPGNGIPSFSSAPPSWATPTFARGWASYDNSLYPVGYTRDAAGWVHLRGRASKSSTPAPTETILTLPAGYRPEKQLDAAAVCNDLWCEVSITPSGAVQLRTLPAGVSTPNWVSLHLPAFYAFA